MFVRRVQNRCKSSRGVLQPVMELLTLKQQMLKILQYPPLGTSEKEVEEALQGPYTRAELKEVALELQKEKKIFKDVIDGLWYKRVPPKVKYKDEI